MIKARILAGQIILPKITDQQTTQEDFFQEVRRRKRRATDGTTGTSKKAAVQIKTSPDLNIPSKEVVTLRAADMDTDASDTEATSNEEAVPGKTGRPPPIILMSTANLIQLQKQLQSVFKENVDLRSTRNGTRVITRSMADIKSVQSHFDTNNLS
jgi:predicted component of type VI protein secretion system